MKPLYVNPLRKAVTKGDLETIRSILTPLSVAQRLKEVNELENESHLDTVLGEICRYVYPSNQEVMLNVLKTVLEFFTPEEQVTLLNKELPSRLTALHAAFKWGCLTPEMLQVLLGVYRDPEMLTAALNKRCVTQEGNLSPTPLYYAAEGKPAIFFAALESLPAEERLPSLLEKGPFGETVYHVAFTTMFTQTQVDRLKLLSFFPKDMQVSINAILSYIMQFKAEFNQQYPQLCEVICRTEEESRALSAFFVNLRAASEMLSQINVDGTVTFNDVNTLMTVRSIPKLNAMSDVLNVKVRVTQDELCLANTYLQHRNDWGGTYQELQSKTTARLHGGMRFSIGEWKRGYQVHIAVLYGVGPESILLTADEVRAFANKQIALYARVDAKLAASKCTSLKASTTSPAISQTAISIFASSTQPLSTSGNSMVIDSAYRR